MRLLDVSVRQLHPLAGSDTVSDVPVRGSPTARVRAFCTNFGEVREVTLGGREGAGVSVPCGHFDVTGRQVPRGCVTVNDKRWRDRSCGRPSGSGSHS